MKGLSLVHSLTVAAPPLTALPLAAVQRAARVSKRFRDAVERQVKQKHVDSRLSQNAELARLGVLGDQILNFRQGDAAGMRHSGCLRSSGRRTDVRVQAAAGSGHEIRRKVAFKLRIVFAECRCICLYPISQLAVGRAEIGTAGCQSIVAIAGSRGPGVKVFGFGKRLADESRTYWLAVYCFQAAVSLVFEDELAKACDKAWIKQAGENCHYQRHAKTWK